MPAKPPKSWLEVQMAIAAVSITATLGFWNVFAGPDHQKALTQAKQATLPPPPPSPTETASPAPTPTIGLVPVKIIFGGTPPKQQVVQVAAPQSPAKNKGGGGGNNNGGNNNSSSVSAPAAPVVNTGSSKP